MKITEAVLVKRIEFKSKEAKERYFQDLRIGGKSFYCLEEGHFKDENGNIKYVILKCPFVAIVACRNCRKADFLG